MFHRLSDTFDTQLFKFVRFPVFVLQKLYDTFDNQLFMLITLEINDTLEPDNMDTFNVWILAFIILQLPNETVEHDNIETFINWN